ncbi:MAG: hypothetical protein ACRC33_05850 [Gemmataceae bacterium]
MRDFGGLLADIARRPGVYVGHFSLWAVANFLDGYCLAMQHMGQPDPLCGWMRWVESRSGICNPAWHWTRILEHEFGSETDALAAIPALFAEYEAEYHLLGLDGILARHALVFAGPQGGMVFREPETTATRDPFTGPDGTPHP